MLLTITLTAPDATDLGFLLHKHPARVQRTEVAAGVAHVFYPEATPLRCTVALLLEVDPVGLLRGQRGGGPEAGSLAQYVNDRPYAASSMLAVALGRAFRTAMAGRCQARPDLVDQRLPLEVRVPALPCRGGAEVAHRLFAPLGWAVRADPVPLDPALPEWGDSRYVDLRLAGRLRLADVLNHLYVLLPVLDDAKHYWVGSDEVEKLVRAGTGWLGTHPERQLIATRYLAHRRSLVASAVGRLAEVDDAAPEDFDNAVVDDSPAGEVAPGAVAGDGAAGDGVGEPPRASLAVRRRLAVLAALREVGAHRVVDFGCGGGALLRELLAEPTITEIVGVDVSATALRLAERRLGFDRMPERRRERIRLLQSSLTYRDTRLHGYDAMVLMEVIEHVDPQRLPAVERTVFGLARPATVVVTTPNVEYNVRYPALAAGAVRHPDHRFEWTRAEFAGWAERVASGGGYQVRLSPVGDEDPEVGAPTQLAVFTSGEGTR